MSGPSDADLLALLTAFNRVVPPEAELIYTGMEPLRLERSFPIPFFIILGRCTFCDTEDQILTCDIFGCTFQFCMFCRHHHFCQHRHIDAGGGVDLEADELDPWLAGSPPIDLEEERPASPSWASPDDHDRTPVYRSVKNEGVNLDEVPMLIDPPLQHLSPSFKMMTQRSLFPREFHDATTDTVIEESPRHSAIYLATHYTNDEGEDISLTYGGVEEEEDSSLTTQESWVYDEEESSVSTLLYEDDRIEE